ncbi:MAG: KH domain-containing protein [candidate division Zixibacteria bacterium]|nr:KH domain-containing protein [candidate division Zixibacteria bacterium]
MRDLIEYITKNLVEKPESVVVNEVAGEKTTIIEVSVDREDIGRIIGKKGRTARALRTILNAAAMKQNKRAALEILE